MGRDSTPAISVRNLEQIRERDHGEPSSRISALVMASFGGACIVFAALALMRTPAAELPERRDPLSDLVAKSEPTRADLRGLDADDVTFPGVLSDQKTTTTAMELVRSQREDGGPLAAEAPTAPPPATDRLPVVPLPAQDVLAETKNGSVAASDTLRNLATEVSRESDSAEVAPSGSPGGYQLQVSSFQEQAEAEVFAQVLRRRGHRAYVESANVKGRGLWHRVRIGPFKYKRSAELYRQDFEAKERMVTFVVDPPKARVRLDLDTAAAD